MLTDKNKIDVCKTLDFCWVFNLNAQMKCMEIFQTLNRVWNDLSARESNFENPLDDSVKFRKLLQTILDKEELKKIAKHPSLSDLARFYPLIHNDAVLGQPYNPGMDEVLPAEVSDRATGAHSEFQKYFEKINENPNSDNCREFRNKLCRLLYVVRSNIAHGSKANYQGSQRNEDISKIIYSILIHICNIMLDNGLFKIAAYGELRRQGRLYESLIQANGGNFLHDGIIDGELLKFDENTLIHNPDLELSYVSVDVIELKLAKDFERIDIIECMPRSLVPYFTEGHNLKGFAWVYNSTINLTNPEGAVHAFERHAKIKNKATAFMYALFALKNKFKSLSITADTNIKIFASIIIKNGSEISFKPDGNDSVLTLPHAAELIAFIDEIEEQFRAIFDSNEEIMPYAKKIMHGVDDVYFDRKHWFKNYPDGKSDPEAIDAYKDLVTMVTEEVAGWICKLLGDDDAELWSEIDNTGNLH